MAADNEDTKASAYCTAVRPSTDYLDRMFYIQHRVGAQSNVLLSAHYASTTEAGQKRLSRAAVYSAVRSVITTYPELSLIGLPETMGKKGRHGLRLAALHEIDLTTCIEFRDDEAPNANAKIIERLHNEWDWTDEQFNPRQPWWKVVVLGGQEVVFVFHHIVCDGRFGHFFHRQFLAALNSFNEDDKPSSNIIKIDPESVRLEQDTEKFWISTTSVLRVVHVFLSFVFLRLFLGSRLLFTNLPKPKPYAKSAITDACPEERTKTRTAVLRIPAPRMRRIIAACRERNTTFTPLLISMGVCTLACDYYPDAKVGISNYALDMRSLYPRENESPRSAKLLQCAGGHSKFTWLSHCRRIFGHPASSTSADDKVDVKTSKVDVDGAWEMVRDYRASMVKGFTDKQSPLLVMFRAANNVSDDLEGMFKSNLPVLGVHLNNAFQVSNLGVFSAGDCSGPWKIDDMSFSASAVNGNISYTINLSVAGAEGGDTVLVACYEDGILTEEMVSEFLEATVERMEAII
ncbi:hypothetical protein G7Z17_g3866 [Cylindrodendrum hubeiense]|uniref:Alcohol acetyltransferase n=1 Tax=Cylindrodendrum hubeiense TaxID=595255 RepID=A0A9P5HH40_9HYPO|nr:hypothetical protein G7Z17_g3866 [Cylindrodendrum hubeiense]